MTRNPPTIQDAGSRLERMLTALMLAGCVAILAFKFFIVWRINVNWDEFWFLSFVHALLRNELTIVLQGAYTHLFTWLPTVGGNEMEQIVAARLVMVILLAVTAWLIWLLGRRWLDGFAATIPPFVYLAFVPVTMHGGSFRADSMLTPLLMGALVLIAKRNRSAREEIFCGVLIGLAVAVTIKTVLFAPMAIALLFLTTWSDSSERSSVDLRGYALPMIRIGAVGAVVAAALILAHSASIAGNVPVIASGAGSQEPVSGYAARTASGMVLDTPLFFQAHWVRQYAFWQPLYWLLMGLGVVAALYRRRYDVAALALALLPVIFYRNAFSYFFIVMLAPASVLAGYAGLAISDYAVSKSARLAGGLALVLWLGLYYQGFARLGRLAQDNQTVQREIVEAVHKIFPERVDYIDRCGMIASFRKANFFMSTWGLQSYWNRQQPFLPQALAKNKPAFVIVNTPALATSNPTLHGLLEEDRVLLQRHYPRYWGPIGVAGAAAELKGDDEARLEVPFAARYRLESSEPVVVNERLQTTGATLDVNTRVVVRLPFEAAASGRLVAIKLILNVARPPPSQDLDPQPIFTGL